MIRFLIPYMLRYYMRTFKYVPALVFFILSVGLIYSYKNISVGYNYSFTAVVLFLFSAWIAIGFLDVEDIIQQQITILHAKKQQYYYLAQISTIFLVSLVGTVCIVFYPIILQFFNRPVTVWELIIITLGHAVSCLLGISVAALFNSRLIENRRTAIVVMLLLLALSSAQNVVIREFPFLQFAAWILPPVSLIVEALLKFNTQFPIDLGLAISLLYPLFYSFILINIYIWLMKRKMF